MVNLYMSSVTTWTSEKYGNIGNGKTDTVCPLTHYSCRSRVRAPRSTFINCWHELYHSCVRMQIAHHLFESARCAMEIASRVVTFRRRTFENRIDLYGYYLVETIESNRCPEFRVIIVVLYLNIQQTDDFVMCGC